MANNSYASAYIPIDKYFLDDSKIGVFIRGEWRRCHVLMDPVGFNGDINRDFIVHVYCDWGIIDGLFD